MSKIRIEIEEQDLIDLLLYTSDLPANAPPVLLRLNDILTDKLNRIIKHREYTTVKCPNSQQNNLNNKK